MFKEQKRFLFIGGPKDGQWLMPPEVKDVVEFAYSEVDPEPTVHLSFVEENPPRYRIARYRLFQIGGDGAFISVYAFEDIGPYSAICLLIGKYPGASGASGNNIDYNWWAHSKLGL